MKLEMRLDAATLLELARLEMLVPRFSVAAVKQHSWGQSLAIGQGT